MLVMRFWLMLASVAGLILTLHLAAPESHAGQPQCFTSDTPSDDIPAPVVIATPVSFPGLSLGGSGSISVAWLAEGNQEVTCYVVERKVGLGEFVQFAIVAVPTDSVLDVGPYNSDDGLFTYRVYAASPDARSAYSNEDDAAFPTVEPNEPLQRGDVDCSGVINPADSLALLRYDAGLLDNLPAGCPPPDFTFGGSSPSSETVLGLSAALMIGGLVLGVRPNGKPRDSDT